MEQLQIVEIENTDITNWDFDSIKRGLEEKLSVYKTMVYTDSSIKSAKEDRAQLNKAVKVIEAARKEYKNRCLAPYNELEPKVKELVTMINEQVDTIKQTVDDYDTRQREEKEAAVRNFYDKKATTLGEYADRFYDSLFDPKWTNQSTTRPKYEAAIQEAINTTAKAIEEIKEMNSPFVDSLIKCYASTLSMDSVRDKDIELREANEKAGFVQPKAEEPEPDEDVGASFEDKGDDYSISFHATEEQYDKIIAFFDSIGVSYDVD